MDWFRLYGEFATDPKVQMMSEAMQRRLVMLFCLECSNGIETFHVTERETSIAFALRVTEEALAETKAVFLAKGFINDDWTLSNWDKRQYVSDSSTARVKAHREKKKREAAERETRMKRSSNAPEQNRTEQNRDIPPPPREADFDSRTKFAMSTDWQPHDNSFPAVLIGQGLTMAMFSEEHASDLFAEFRSFWVATPDEHRTQAKWEHALASHMKRNLRSEQAAGRNGNAAQQSGSRNAQDHHGDGSQGRNQQSSRTGTLSAPDRVRAAIAERDAVTGVARQAVDQDG